MSDCWFVFFSDMSPKRNICKIEFCSTKTDTAATIKEIKMIFKQAMKYSGRKPVVEERRAKASKRRKREGERKTEK